MSITSLTSYFNTASFGDGNTYTRNQEELALTLDSAAHQLADWKGLLAMSSGGMGFELGSLAARTLFAATPALCAIPFLTNAFTFFVGALSDTGLTRVVNYFLENGGEESESFFEQVTSQGGVRAMGFLGAGQNFVVVQVLMGLSSVSQDHGPANGAFLHSLIQGLRCYFGSGMFTSFTGGVLGAVEQRIKLKTNNINVGGQHAPEAHQPLAGGSPLQYLEKLFPHPLAAGATGIHLRIADSSPEHQGGGGGASASNIFKPVTIQLNKKISKELTFEELENVTREETARVSWSKITRRRAVYRRLGYTTESSDPDEIKAILSNVLRKFAKQAEKKPSSYPLAYPKLLEVKTLLDLNKLKLKAPVVETPPPEPSPIAEAPKPPAATPDPPIQDSSVVVSTPVFKPIEIRGSGSHRVSQACPFATFKKIVEVAQSSGSRADIRSEVFRGVTGSRSFDRVEINTAIGRWFAFLMEQAEGNAALKAELSPLLKIVQFVPKAKGKKAALPSTPAAQVERTDPPKGALPSRESRRTEEDVLASPLLPPLCSVADISPDEFKNLPSLVGTRSGAKNPSFQGFVRLVHASAAHFSLPEERVGFIYQGFYLRKSDLFDMQGSLRSLLRAFSRQAKKNPRLQTAIALIMQELGI